MTQSVVSIIIPIYKVEKYIERCIRSIISQTYPCLECILVNDCSPDRSVSIAEDVIRQYNGSVHFKIVHHDHNKGLSAARNTGVNNSTGDYIYFLDSDDELPTDAIELLYSWVTRYPKVEVVVGELQNLEICGNTKKDIGYFFDYRGSNIGYVENHEWIVRHCFDYEQNVVIPVNGVNKLIKKSFFVENNLYFKEGIIHEDERWLFDLSNHLTKIAFCEDITYLRYITKDSIMTTPNRYWSLLSWSNILGEVFPQLEEPCLRLKKAYCVREAARQYLSISRIFATNKLSIIFKYQLLLFKMLACTLSPLQWKLVKAILLSIIYPQILNSRRLERYFFRKIVSLTRL